jgi:hypothetical protein
MIEILREKFLAHYYHVALIDHEAPDAYPQWETGEEAAIAGPKGVVVATPTDRYIETIVLSGEGRVTGMEIITGTIEVGQAGLSVGNEISASYQIISWPAGKTIVKAYRMGLAENEFCIAFVLKTEGQV